MQTKRISDAMEESLNQQLSREADAAQVYLSYGTWADAAGLPGVANFLMRHAAEERNHMMKILEYVQARGGRAKIRAIAAGPKDPAHLQECFEMVFRQETDNTASIYRIVNQSMQEQDWATWNFLQWFVKEQAEEETMALALLDRVRIAGGKDTPAAALLQLDTELQVKKDDAADPVNATAENP